MSSKNKNNKVGPFKHYTSLHAFKSMIDLSLKEVHNCNMEVHLSRLDKANDMEEMYFLMDKIKELSNNKKKIEDKIKDYFDKYGFPTYMSLSYPGGSSVSNEIPMWSMYSRHKESPGICLFFNFENDITPIKCNYINKKKIKIKAMSFDTSVVSEELIESIIKESIFTKNSKWRFENEYRIVQFCKNFYHYAKGRENVEYDKIWIPIQYLSCIVISPFEKESEVRKELNKIREELKIKVQNKEYIKFQIKKSLLKIR